MLQNSPSACTFRSHRHTLELLSPLSPPRLPLSFLGVTAHRKLQPNTHAFNPSSGRWAGLPLSLQKSEVYESSLVFPAPFFRRVNPGINCVESHSGLWKSPSLKRDGGWQTLPRTIPGLLPEIPLLSEWKHYPAGCARQKTRCHPWNLPSPPICN